MTSEHGKPARDWVTVLWFPDFPIYAVVLAKEWDLLKPAAIIKDYRVLACNAAARRQGISQGMKQRHALATCPDLVVAPANPGQELMVHDDVVASLMTVAAGVETLRPGLVALPTRPLANYYGDEDSAVELLLDTAARMGAECLAGTADDLVPAVWAARRGVSVPPNKTAAFLAELPIETLVSEPALGGSVELTRLLAELGVRTFRQFARLRRADVAGRFGQEATYWHRVAQGLPGREVAPQRVADPIEVMHQVEHPIQNTETAAFVARQAATRLHNELFRHGDACLRLVVRAHVNPPSGDDGPEVVERAWRCREPLTAEDTAQRVRWQLDGWLTRLRINRAESVAGADAQGARARGFGVQGADCADDGFSDDAAGIVAIELVPMETVPAGTIAEPLWGGPDEGIRAARAAAGRAQALIGMQAVRQVVHRGGRGVGGRVVAVPYGDETPEAVAGLPTTQWVGELPSPLPSVVGPLSVSAASSEAVSAPSGAHPASKVQVLDDVNQQVYVTGRATMSSSPAVLRWGSRGLPITGWAGPWPVDEQWWAAGRRYARVQVATETGAYLLVSRGKQWRIEATY